MDAEQGARQAAVLTGTVFHTTGHPFLLHVLPRPILTLHSPSWGR